MDRNKFYQHLDELAEVWYIDSHHKMLDIEVSKQSLRREKKKDLITTEQLIEIVNNSESNPSGYPIVERWKQPVNPEIIRITDFADKYH